MPAAFAAAVRWALVSPAVTVAIHINTLRLAIVLTRYAFTMPSDRAGPVSTAHACIRS